MRVSYKWLVQVVVALATLTTTLDGGVMAIAFPALARAFQTDVSAVIWVSILYWLVSTGLAFTLGWMGDVWGRKTVYLMGFWTFTLALGLAASAQNLPWLLGARVLQGVGASVLVANGQALLTAAVPPRERGRALGINSGVVGLGLGFGPILGGFLLTVGDWRALFWARLPLAMASALLAGAVLRREPPLEKRVPVDWWGAGLLFAVLGAFLLAVNRAGAWGIGHPLVWGLAGATLALVPMLVWVERRAVRPVVDLAMLGDPAFGWAMLALVLHYLAWGAYNAVGAFYLLEGRGLSQEAAGAVLAALPLVRVVVAPLAGMLCERVPPHYVMGVGNLWMLAGLAVVGGLGVGGGLGWVVLGFAMMGLGSAFYEPSYSTHIMSAARRDRLGTANASISTGRQIGLSGGLALAGAVYATRLGAYVDSAATDARAIAWAFRDASWACAVTAVGSVLAVGALVRAVASPSPRSSR
ncbi:MAG: MFS transporter [Dehalococcoidia bacterium]|nr:MFS transporter [Dehalococcoidia bacterium]MDW8119523.1 MFS transporter [Chloroflexota bacterium]